MIDPYRSEYLDAKAETEALRADLAKAQARVAELAGALKWIAGFRYATTTDQVLSAESHAQALLTNQERITAKAESTLASDGTEALAAVRLAQGVCDELLTSGASIYGDGRLSDEMRAQVIAASNAMDKAFGDGT